MQFLNTTESQSLRCDLIRFIIGVIHPSNEVLCSDITPRWAVIGWLLSSCTSATATANCKLALFYDWLFFSGDSDNIMNIEPGILVMYHSLKPHPMLTTTLLDFLCRIIPQFQPTLTTHVRQGVTTSLRQILDKRVIPNVEPLFDNTRMDPELRKLVRETFPEFCSNLTTVAEDFHASSAAPISRMDLMAETGLDFGSGSSGPEVELNNHHPSVEEDATFSDEDDDSAGSNSSNSNSSSVKVVASHKYSTSRTRSGADASLSIASSVAASISLSSSSTLSSVPTNIPSNSSQRNSNSTSSDTKSSGTPPPPSSTSNVSNSNSTANSTNNNNNNLSNTKTNDSLLKSIASVCSNVTSDEVIDVTEASDEGVSVNGGVVLLNGGRTSKCGAGNVNSLTATQTQELHAHLDCFETDMRDYLLDFKAEKDQTRR